jgi:dTDP-4-dehydrorhamnose 3,5-epimerase
MIEAIETPIEGLILLKHKIFYDERGWFLEAYNSKALSDLGINANFVQDNISESARNVLRGLHFQNPPASQGKLVRVLKGSAFDVAVDIRKNSPTYGKYFSVELTAENGMALWIPEGFAHGFLSLEDKTIFYYKCTSNYSKTHEDSILYDDPSLNIDWPVNATIMSSKDKDAQSFKSFKSLF